MREIEYLAAAEDDGRELKRILRTRLSISHRQLGSLKAEGGLFLNDEPARANALVHAGDRLTVRLPDQESGAAEPCPGKVDIVYEDDDLMVLNKEAPLACQSSDRQPRHSLENRLAYLFAQRGEPFLFRPVNRLDRGTSGLMVAAKHAHAQNLLQEQLHTPDFVREYLAVLAGSLPCEAGVVDAPIGKADGATVRRCIRPESEGGRPSRTDFRVLARCEERTLVRLRLQTGRTHQIRVHMQSLGCPVFGDFLYGQEDERLPGRFALHSAYLRLLHPLSGRELIFTQPLPPELAGLCTDMQESESASKPPLFLRSTLDKSGHLW